MDEDDPDFSPPGELLQQALRELAGEETQSGRLEREGQNDLTVVGPIPEDLGDGVNEPFQFGDLETILALDSTQIRQVPRCFAGEWFDFGSVSCHSNDKAAILFSYGSVIMLQTSSIKLMECATRGRLTPERVWRFAMRHANANAYVLDGLDYGEVAEGIDQFLLAAPGLGRQALVTLEKRPGGVEAIKEAIVHEGKWWIWMRPDLFPLDSALNNSTPPSLTNNAGGPAASSSPTSLTSLPTDILLSLSSFLTLQSLLALCATSRHVRSRILVREGRDVARAWLGGEGEYWLPSNDDRVPEAGWWSYVKRCAQSGSMRNRKRIWAVVGRLEEMVLQAEEQESRI